jgi:hypothetical protein
MSGEFVIALVVALAGLFVPIPLMVLEILVGIVQAYIFTVLATVFIGCAAANASLIATMTCSCSGASRMSPLFSTSR